MRLTFDNLSPLAILVGLLASQALAASLALALVICFLFIYGNAVLVAFFEYASSIALTLFIGLLATAFGGYVAMLTPKKALVNALLVGVLTLALNLGLWFGTDIGYGIEFPLMLIAAALLTVPAALLGGWLYLRQHATA